jgi:hypothetical protein
MAHTSFARMISHRVKAGKKAGGRSYRERLPLLPRPLALPDGREPENDGLDDPDGREPENDGLDDPDGREPENDGLDDPDGRDPLYDGLDDPDGRDPLYDGLDDPDGREPENDGLDDPDGREPENDGLDDPDGRDPLYDGLAPLPESTRPAGALPEEGFLSPLPVLRVSSHAGLMPSEEAGALEPAAGSRPLLPDPRLLLAPRMPVPAAAVAWSSPRAASPSRPRPPRFFSDADRALAAGFSLGADTGLHWALFAILEARFISMPPF